MYDITHNNNIKRPFWDLGCRFLSACAPRSAALSSPLLPLSSSLSFPSSWFQSLPHQTQPHTPPNGVCRRAQSWLSVHSELRINAAVAPMPQKSSVMQATVCLFTRIPAHGRRRVSSPLSPKFEYPELTHTHTHIHLQYNRAIKAVTYTGSTAPRLPLEKLCCSRIVWKRENKDSHQTGFFFFNSFFIPVVRHKQIQESAAVYLATDYVKCAITVKWERAKTRSIDSGDGRWMRSGVQNGSLMRRQRRDLRLKSAKSCLIWLRRSPMGPPWLIR